MSTEWAISLNIRISKSYWLSIQIMWPTEQGNFTSRIWSMRYPLRIEKD